MGRARHSKVGLDAAAETLKLRKKERLFYFLTQFLLAQLVLLPMLARGLENDMDWGWGGVIGAFVLAFALLMTFGLAVSMRQIRAHLKKSLAIWEQHDDTTQARYTDGDYMLVVVSDAGLLVDTPMQKAFVPPGTVTRARFAGLQFDIDWREGEKKRHASFHVTGDKSMVQKWVRENNDPGLIQHPGGDAVSKGRAVFNAFVAIGIILWIVGMIFM